MTDYDTALEALKASTEEMVSANQIAPILHMNPGVIVKYAKDGTWNQDTLGKFVISGDRVKFFRRDFLQKCGFLEPEPEEKSTEMLILEQLIGINEGVTMICQMLTLMMKPYQLDVLNEIIKEKTAGAATPTVSGKDCQHEQS